MIKRSNRGKLSGSLGGRVLPDTRKGTQRKRSLWSLITAAVAIALVGLFTVGTGVSYADTPSTTDSAPEHHKTLKYNSDGTYDVTLTVEGKVESNTQTNRKPVDVIIVLDRSNSMAEGIDGNKNPAEDRLALSKRAANSLIDTVFSSENLDPRVSVVDFGTYARVYNNGYAASMNAQDAAWYESEDSAKNAVKKVKYIGNDDLRGGTNWQDAFKVANAIPASKTDNSSRGATRYIIFLSDGDPTYRDEYINNDGYNEYYESYTYTYGAKVNSYGQFMTGVVYNPNDARSYSYFGMASSDPRNYNFDCGVKEAKKRDKSTTLYCIGLSSDASKMSDFAGKTNSTSYYSATNTAGLNDAFKNIAADITGSNKSYKDVTITDTLSQWAEFPDAQNVTVTYQKTTEKATETYVPKTTAQVDTDKNEVTWAVNDKDGDTTLDDGATYSITFKVRPNQAAYDRALNIKNNPNGAKSDEGVNATGEVNPDDPAIFSNVNSNDNDNPMATGVSGTQITTITNNGKPSSSTTASFSSAYVEKPVMHVPVSCVTVKKVWDKSVPTDMYGTVSVTLQKKSDNGWVTVDNNLVLSGDKDWTATKYVVAGVGDQTYKVVETKIANQNIKAFNTTYAYSVNGAEKDGLTFEGGKHCEGTATITNSLNVCTLTIAKKVTGNFGDTSKAFKFKLTDQNDGALANATVVNGENQTSTRVTFDEKDGSFDLKDGEKLVVTLPYGTAYKVVEDKSNDSNDSKYDTSISVVSADDKKVETTGASYIDDKGITKNTAITYTNSRTVKPEVGVDLGSGAPYAAIFGGAGLAGVIWMVLRRRNSLGI